MMGGRTGSERIVHHRIRLSCPLWLDSQWWTLTADEGWICWILSRRPVVSSGISFAYVVFLLRGNTQLELNYLLWLQRERRVLQQDSGLFHLWYTGTQPWKYFLCHRAPQTHICDSAAFKSNGFKNQRTLFSQCVRQQFNTCQEER